MIPVAAYPHGSAAFFTRFIIPFGIMPGFARFAESWGVVPVAAYFHGDTASLAGFIIPLRGALRFTGLAVTG